MKILLLALGFLLTPLFTFADVRCECVSYLRIVQGVNIRGDARVQVPNTQQVNAEVGEKDIGTAIVPEQLIIHEANFERCRTTTRWIPWDDPHILGILRPNKNPPV